LKIVQGFGAIVGVEIWLFPLQQLVGCYRTSRDEYFHFISTW